jgi:hypothetical protein
LSENRVAAKIAEQLDEELPLTISKDLPLELNHSNNLPLSQQQQQRMSATGSSFTDATADDEPVTKKRIWRKKNLEASTDFSAQQSQSPQQQSQHGREAKVDASKRKVASIIPPTTPPLTKASDPILRHAAT